MENVITNQITPPITPPLVPNDRISYGKFLEWNGETGWFEWIDGEVVKMSNPSLKHQDLSDFLAALLRFFVEFKECGKIISAPFQLKMEFRPSGRQPDIMFIANENLHRLEKQYVDGTADLIVEIVSPESFDRDTREKFEEYEKAGVREYWIIDYRLRTANFYGFDESGKYQLLPIEGGKFTSRVVEGFWLQPEWLWRVDLPNLTDVLKELKVI